jgi:hypothetical protein
MYLEGSWVNCDNLNIVENTHTFKMNQSAVKQIAEQNSKNTLQIGKKYVINESTYTYIGRNSFSLGGNLLSESMNSKIHRIVEASTPKFSNFVAGNKDKPVIPNKFSLNDHYVYDKDKNAWWSRDGHYITNKTDSEDLFKSAYKDIAKYNNEESYPVGSSMEYNGERMTWTGNNWVYENGRIAGNKFTDLVDSYITDNPDFINSSTSSDSTNNSENSSTSSDSDQSPYKVGQHIRDKYGKVYRFDGTDFVDSSGTKLSSDETSKILKGAKEWQDAKNNGNEDEYRKNNTTNLGSKTVQDPKSPEQEQQSSPEQEQQSSSPEQEPQSNNSDVSDSQASDENNSSNDLSSDVPNGYVHKSKKGNSYYKKNGQWFNSATKRPVSSSSVPMLERSAQAEIGKLNSSSPVKIGQEFKSKKGITYHYVGDNRFISDNGKLLPPDTAQKVLASLSQQSSGDESSSEDQPQDKNTDTSNGSGTTSQEQPKTGTTSGDEGTNSNEPLQGLATEIKSSSYARNIIVLLSRGDDLSLLAADILLSGQQKEVAEILKSLNNED